MIVTLLDNIELLFVVPPIRKHCLKQTAGGRDTRWLQITFKADVHSIIFDQLLYGSLEIS